MHRVRQAALRLLSSSRDAARPHRSGSIAPVRVLIPQNHAIQKRWATSRIHEAVNDLQRRNPRSENQQWQETYPDASALKGQGCGQGLEAVNAEQTRSGSDARESISDTEAREVYPPQEQYPEGEKLPAESVVCPPELGRAVQVAVGSFSETEAYGTDGASDSRQSEVKIIRPYPAAKETLYIGNLLFEVTAEDLRRFCEKFGVVEHAVVIHNDRGKSLGFGYVTFDFMHTAMHAKEELDGKIFEGRRIYVNYAMAHSVSRRARPATRTLYIGNVPFEISDRDLQDLFMDIANIIDVRVAVDKGTGRCRGFVHAEFIDVESAQMAHEVLRRRSPYGRKLKVDYADSTKRAQMNSTHKHVDTTNW